MTYKVIPDPEKRPNHWIINDKIVVAGATSADDAIEKYEESLIPVQEEEVKITANMVRDECDRRLIKLTGARDSKHLSVMISNSTRQGLALEHLRLGTPDPNSDGWLIEPREWTQDEKLRAYELQQANTAIDYIREKSNILEKMSPIPLDFEDDKYWS